MGTLATEIRRRMKRLGLTQKELAARFHTRHEALVSAADEQLSFNTIPPKLSKLLKGDTEGETFFFCNEHRTTALAEALEQTHEWLEEHRRASSVHRTLVLDPLIEDDARQYLQRRQSELDEPYSLVAVEAEDIDVEALREKATGQGWEQKLDASDRQALDTIKTTIRDAAHRSNNPLVVLGRWRDKEFYAGANIEVTTLEKHPRGYVVNHHEDLVPLPDPPAPRRYDGGGTPLFPVPVEQEEVPWEREKESIYVETIGPALERGEIPELSVGDALRWFEEELKTDEEREQRHDREAPRVRFVRRPPTDPVLVLGEGIGRYSEVWIEDGNIFCHGVHFPRVRELFKDYHEVHEHPLIAHWQALTSKSTNPWWIEDQLRDGNGPVLAPFLEHLGDDSEEAATEVVRRHCCAPQRERLVEFLTRESRDVVIDWTGEHDDAIRSELRALAARPSVSAPEAVRLHLLLGHAAGSRLTWVQPTDWEILRVFVDPGGGKLFELRVAALECEPRPFVRRKVEERSIIEIPYELFEGGDRLVYVARYPSHLPGGRMTPSGEFDFNSEDGA